MVCDHRQDQLLLYAAGALEPAECDLLQAHLDAGCQTCAEFLRDTEQVLAQFGATLQPIQPPPQLKERLMRKLGEPQSDTRIGAPGIARSSQTAEFPVANLTRKTLLRTAVWSALAGALVMGIGMHLFVVRPKQIERERIAKLSDLQEGRIEQLTGQIQFANNTLLTFHSPLLSHVALQATPAAPKARGQVLFDKYNSELHCYLSGLDELTGADFYAIWLRDVSGKTRLASQIKSGSSAAVLLSVPEELGQVTGLIISREIGPDPPAPSNTLLLTADFDSKK